MRTLAVGLFALVTSALAVPDFTAAAAGSCSDLAKMALPHATITVGRAGAGGRVHARRTGRRRTVRRAAGVLPRRRDAEAVERLRHQDRSLAARRRLERQVPGGRQRRVQRHDRLSGDGRARSRAAMRRASTDTGHTGGSASFALGHPGEARSTSAGARCTR